jgi:hypothetical protein
MLNVKIDTKPIDHTFECMEKQIQELDSLDMGNVLLDWLGEDLHRRNPRINIESKTAVSTAIVGEEPVLQSGQMDQLKSRMMKMMHDELSWKCITPPKEFRFRMPKGGAAWLGWEKLWIKHRRAEFQQRYGQRAKKILFSTAYLRSKHHYPHG